MTGCGRGCSNSQRKNNGHRRGNASQNKRTDKEKKSLSDYKFDITLISNNAEFTKILKYLINVIKQKFSYGDDIATALEDKIPFDMTLLRPLLSTSMSTDTDVKQREDKEFKILYVAQVKKFVNQQDTYGQNLIKAYGFIYGQCTKIMLE